MSFYTSSACTAGQQPGSKGEQAVSVPEDGQEDEGSETTEQYLMRRTRDLNVATRERPFDLQLWLDFAAYQDVLGGCAPLPCLLSDLLLLM
jgi:hypothetical protein